MIRITRTVFADLAIWMIAFGVLVGLALPFFVIYVGVPHEIVLTGWFFSATILAGIIIGAVSFFLVKGVVGTRLRLLADRMRYVETQLERFSQLDATAQYAPVTCFVEEESEDEIGESAEAFNNLVSALASSLHTEAVIRAFSETLSSHLDVKTIAHQALHQLIQLITADAGAILVESNGELKLLTAFGLASEMNLTANERIRYAMRTGERQRIGLPEDIVLEGVVTTFQPREVIIEPILYKQVPLGVIVLAGSHEFDTHIDRNIDLLRHGLALALNNAVIHERLQHLAALDPLTGAYNRRFGLARLHEEYGRAVRSGTPLGLMIFDIDHFKDVNDTYGHLVGDRVLVKISQVARSAIREGDIMLRYGGEEFLIVLPSASKTDMHRLSERIRRLVEDTSVTEDEQTVRVTISVGSTSFPHPDIANEEALIKRADEALYQAKQTGRNRVATI